jgi:hypothetical protein
MKRALVLVVVAGCAKSSPPSEMPRLDDTAASSAPDRVHGALRPTFFVEGKRIVAGTAFVLQLPDEPALLVTAFHLFGTAGGNTRDITWDEAPRVVTKMAATSVEDRDITVTAGPPLAIEGAAGMTDARVTGDVAALPVIDGSRAGSLVVASAMPAVGARVTLLAEVIGGTEFRHGATVVQVDADVIAYKFDKPIEIRATSGAAVVDEQGRVVAINLGAMDDKTGAVIGIGNPATAFEPAIRRALATYRTKR